MSTEYQPYFSVLNIDSLFVCFHFLLSLSFKATDILKQLKISWYFNAFCGEEWSVELLQPSVLLNPLIIVYIWKALWEIC